MKTEVIFIFIFLSILFSVNAIYCGDNNLDEGEFCDTNRVGHYQCVNFSYDGGELGCLEDCSGYDYTDCFGDDICGNDIIDEFELCDGNNTRERTCEDEGYGSGTLNCDSDCKNYDYSGCTLINSTELNITEEINETANITEEINITENITEEINETINESSEDLKKEVPSGVKGAISDISNFDFGLRLSDWLIVFTGILVLGVVILWLYVFKIEK
jgi:hypothetical protein